MYVPHWLQNSDVTFIYFSVVDKFFLDLYKLQFYESNLKSASYKSCLVRKMNISCLQRLFIFNVMIHHAPLWPQWGVKLPIRWKKFPFKVIWTLPSFINIIDLNCYRWLRIGLPRAPLPTGPLSPPPELPPQPPPPSPPGEAVPPPHGSKFPHFPEICLRAFSQE